MKQPSIGQLGVGLIVLAFYYGLIGFSNPLGTIVLAVGLILYLFG